MTIKSLKHVAALEGGILTLENGQTLNLSALKLVLREYSRCMSHMVIHGELPADTCPADLYTYAYERLAEVEILK